jgi:hypothetical protein
VAHGTPGGPASYPRIITYINAGGLFSEEQKDSLSWFDAVTCTAEPDIIAEMRERNPDQRILYRCMPQNISDWYDPEDPCWYPDTTHSLLLLCAFYAEQNDWYLYDIHGERITEWSGYAANWTRYCPEGTYGTSQGMTYAEWYINVALPQIAYNSPDWEPWGWGASSFDGLSWEIMVDCPQFWNPTQFAIADPDRDGEIEGIQDYCWEGGAEDSLSILYREINEYFFERMPHVLADDMVINMNACGTTINPWWAWEVNGLKLEGWRPDGPAPFQSWWSWMHGYHSGGELKRGGYEFAERHMHPHGVDEREGWEASWIFIHTGGEDPTSPYWQRMMRWGLGTTMLGDGYFTMQPRGGSYALWWFDEYDWDFGMPAGDYAAELVGLQDTLYVRLFEAGLVEVNPYGHSLSGVPAQDTRFGFWLTLADLEVESVGDDSVTLTWVVPGCETNVVEQTRIRYATFPITAENWEDCTPAPAGPVLADEGETIHYTVDGLSPETAYFFAAKNIVYSRMEPLISNVVEATTGEGIPHGDDETPPASITDLSSPYQGETWVRLVWSATGDDGYEGQADHYILGYLPDETIDDEADWEEATKITDGLPSPALPGVWEAYHLNGLDPGSSYGIAIRVVDEADNMSGLSNPLLVTTRPPDQEPPELIDDMLMTGTYPDGFDIQWTAPGDDGDQGTASSYILGHLVGRMIDDQSDWDDATKIIAGLPAPLPAGTVQSFELRGLLAETDYGVTLRAYDDGGNISPLGSTWLAQTSGEEPDVTPPATISDFALAEAGESWLRLEWTAPGDDGDQGTADHFALAWIEGTDPIETEEQWEAANLVAAGLPEPPPVGDPVEWELADLPPGLDYSLAVRAYDDADLAGGISNPLIASTLPEGNPGGDEDTIPPAGIDDLLVTAIGDTWAMLSWSCPGDDGEEGVATSFILAWMEGEGLLTEASWEAATKITAGLPEPDSSGTTVSYNLLELAGGQTYCVAVRALDDADLLSPLAAPLVCEPGVSPAAVADLDSPDQGETWVRLTWTATGDDGLEGRADHYLLRYHEGGVIAGESDWGQATPVASGLPDPAPPGSEEEFVLADLSAGCSFGVAVRVVDECGNVSGLSNSLQASTMPSQDTEPPAAVDTLHVMVAHEDGFDLQWVAVGDDGNEGTAAAYILGYLTGSAIASESDWESAIRITQGLPDPQGAGELESYELRGLLPETLYGIMLRASDEAGNLSALGAAPLVQTASEGEGPGPDVDPDVTPPAAITDLILAEAGETWLSVEWTAPGDDGDTGTADHFELAWTIGAEAIETAGDWESANLVVDGLPTPPSAGERVEWVLTDLASGLDYSLAVRAIDDTGLAGGISNPLVAATLPEEPPDTEEDTTPPAAIDDLALTDIGDTWATLSWSCPGDDAWDGRADSFVLAWIEGQGLWTEASWETAAKITEGLPEPDVSGTIVCYELTGLAGGQTYSVAVRAYDDAGLLSCVGAPLVFTAAAPLDTLPPGRVDDLVAVLLDEGIVQLSWTAAGDDGFDGTAVTLELALLPDRAVECEEDRAAADLRLFENATPGGQPDTLSIADLAPGETWGLALRYRDGVGLAGEISNSVVVTIPSEGSPVDTIAPAPVVDLRVTEIGDDWVMLLWSATGDDDITGQAAGYLVGVLAGSALTDSSWEQAGFLCQVPGARAEFGTPQVHQLEGLVPGADYGVALKALDEVGNTSNLSNAVWIEDVTARSVSPPETVNDLTAVQIGTDWIDLTWSAPTCHEPEGAVVTYDIAFTEEPLSDANWLLACRVASPPIPAAPGEEEAFRLTLLSEGSGFWIAIKGRDQLGNWSPLSNVVAASTHVTDDHAPTPPPGPVPDLGDEGGIVAVSWSASPDADVIGYNVYGRTGSESAPQRLNSELIQATTWSFPVPEGRRQFYISVAAVDASWNESAPGRETAIFPEQAQLEGPFPHPIVDESRFLLTLPPGSSGSVRVEAQIFSVLGAPVRRWVEESFPAGSQVTLHWDARNDAGASVAPGLYFLRLDTAEGSLLRKIYVKR